MKKKFTLFPVGTYVVTVNQLKNWLDDDVTITVSKIKKCILEEDEETVYLVGSSRIHKESSLLEPKDIERGLAKIIKKKDKNISDNASEISRELRDKVIALNKEE